ncbi:Ig-like domain-containing protein [Meiothermus sp.]|uniref:Ig-like domain-containing protein n=1 Tax=Meiothermus sp. TaxID=1955249 RepID=UPI0021DEBDE7|nr:Ig-like domain-containing protein [Meiothermus sp.]GIW24352.1 MAG: hypothetical protein KatS3mg069_0619 [Meiothermus sp.]
MNRRQAIKSLGIGGAALLVSCSSVDQPGTDLVAELSSDTPQATCPGTIVLRIKVKSEYEKENGAAVKVEFYRGDTLLGTKTSPPWTLSIPLTKDNIANYAFDDEDEKEKDEAQKDKKLYKAKVFFGNGTVKITNKVKVKVSRDCGAGGDTTPPTISLSASSTTVSAAGSVSLMATASDNVGIVKVEFYEGNTLLATKTSAPFSHNIAYTGADNGTHTYTAKAYDAAGNTSSSNSVSVVVNIGGGSGDTTPPTISLAASSTNVTAAGSVNLMPTVSDNVGVVKVEFYEDATLLATKTAPPFTHSIAYTGANNGSHSYTAKAYDAAGNSATSNVVVVNVNIGATPTGQKVATLAEFPTVGSFKRLSNVNIGGQPWNIIIIRTANGQPACGGASANGVNLVAYSANCTHKGTLVQNPGVMGTKPGTLYCDNHGAEFDYNNCAYAVVGPNNGAAGSTPALPSFVLTIDASGNVYLPQ